MYVDFLCTPKTTISVVNKFGGLFLLQRYDHTYDTFKDLDLIANLWFINNNDVVDIFTETFAI